MNEHICPKCDGPLKWVGSIFDGHMECPHCLAPSAEQPSLVEVDCNIKNLNAAPLKKGAAKKFEDNEFDDGTPMLQDQHVHRRAGRTTSDLNRLLRYMMGAGKDGVYVVDHWRQTPYILGVAENILAELGIHHPTTWRKTRYGVSFYWGDRWHTMVVKSVDTSPRGMDRKKTIAMIDHSCFEYNRRSTLYQHQLCEWRNYYENSEG